MSSVTQRISQVKQPYGGYIRPSMFKKVSFDDGITLNAEENIHSSIVGLAVDYLTRFMVSGNILKSFEISIRGAAIAGEAETAGALLGRVSGVDSDSVVSACKLAAFDVWYRDYMYPLTHGGTAEMNPDSDTISNIQTMVERSRMFVEEYGPVLEYGFTFEPDGYTLTVDAGDGDFLTADTLWDFKVSKNKPTSKQTLQLLMYWIMGQHSGQEIFEGITRLGIFNPRLNAMYTLDMQEVPEEVIRAVEDEVICY
ncbi:MAG: hypothetical protein IJR85_05240 [Synergistaceae bacterium]|nr:hypothetical protein [Synergistaceae bacterium]